MRILIADKHDLFRQSLTLMLRGIYEQTMSLEETDNCKDMWELLDQKQFDLIVTGSNILDDKEPYTLRKIRYRSKQAPILAVMENQCPKLMESLKRHRPNGIICKTATPDTYKEALIALIEGRRHLYATQTTEDNPKPQTGQLQQAKLTKRQKGVLRLIAEGQSNRDIATILKLSEGTVKVHVTAILKTLDVKNRTQAMLLVQRNQIQM